MNRSRQLINISKDSSFKSKIPINAPVQLEYGSKKWISAVRGSKFSKYILVDRPESNNGLEEFERKKIFARFLVEGTVYGYEAGVMKEESKPPILVLEYPESIYMFPLRKNKRVKTLHPISILLDKHSKALDGALVDFSDRGALLALETSAKIKYDEQLTISLTLSNGLIIESLLCNVSNARKSGDKQLVGVSFDKGDENKNALNSMKSFYSYCYNIYSAKEINLGETRSQVQELFYVGQEITLEFHKKSMRSFVRGCRIYRNEGYILCDLPEIADQKQFPKAGDVMVVNYTVEGKKCRTAMEFESVLHKINLWKLTHLIEPIEHSFRKHERYQSLILAKITNKVHYKIEKIGEGLLNDISLSGAKLITNKLLTVPLGSTIDLSFQLGEYGTIEYQEFKILHKENKKNFYVYPGIFVNITAKSQSKFDKFFEFCKKWKVK